MHPGGGAHTARSAGTGASPAGGQQPAARNLRRRWHAAAWAAAGLAAYGLLLKASYGGRIDSDGANSALQGWDLIHGHLLMHGWLFGDATFYAFELPANGLAELIFGLGPRAAHVASAVVYFIVLALAVALAVTGSRGAARVTRGAATVAVLAVPLLTPGTLYAFLEEPDHPGTAAFLLATALLAGRWPGRRFTPVLAGAALAAGQLSDATVLYVGVPAVVLGCGYRALAARRVRRGEMATAAAAIASVPAALAIRALEVHAGGYQVTPPQTAIAPPAHWLGQLPAAWQAIRSLFGAASAPGTLLGAAGPALGWLALAGAIAGLARVAWGWRRASAADQLLALFIVFNLGAFAAGHPAAGGAHEIPLVAACGAALAARLVPAQVAVRAPGKAVAVAAALALAVVPLSAAASRPPAGPALGPAPGNGRTAATAPLTSWLQGHGYAYGLSSYWSSSVVTLQSGGQVALRAITAQRAGTGAGAYWQVRAPYWESNALWFDPALHDATFVVADQSGEYSAATYERAFGRPAAMYPVAGRWLVLDYRRNLLTRLLPRLPAGQGPKS